MIYYSHVNEDNQAERKAMAGKFIQSLYAIAGSGERVIALLDHPSLETIHVIDNNKEALYLTELKLVALDHFSVDDYLSFVGFKMAKTNRWKQFVIIKEQLSEDCRTYWMEKKKTIEKGICFSGHFEKFLKRINPLIRIFLGNGFYKCFTNKMEEIKNFPVFRWRLIQLLFSWKISYRIAGMKDDAFLSKESNIKIIPNALQKTIVNNEVNQSCLFHLVFKGHLKDMQETLLPPSFQKSVLLKIKAALKAKRLSFFYHYGDVLAVLKQLSHKNRGTNFYSFSDLLSFENYEYLTDLVKEVSAKNKGSNLVVFRAFLRNRLKEHDINKLEKKFGPVIDLSKEDRTQFYQVFQVNIRQTQ